MQKYKSLRIVTITEMEYIKRPPQRRIAPCGNRGYYQIRYEWSEVELLIAALKNGYGHDTAHNICIS